jgi:mRNA-degrading endonuclease toxin of MazEF toxin-antitoxin module
LKSMNCGGHSCRSLLSRNNSYRSLNKFITGEITTTIRNIAIQVPLGSREGHFDNLRTVAREWLIERIGKFASARHVEVKRALGYALAWDELIDLGE